MPKNLSEKPSFSLQGTLHSFSKLFSRFRYPIALPEDVGESLGLELSNTLLFHEFLEKLTCPHCYPSHLFRFMSRKEAERAFTNAQKKEIFKQCSLFSYAFSEGWVEFKLEFDDCSTLRRIYVHHHTIDNERGLEIPLLCKKMNDN